ncbi:MAG: pantetheine-phosphate adenylyltransferase [Hyphomicrobiales bacterium]
MKRVALFPGSFDPITNGHVDVIRAGLALVDEVVVAIGQNPTKTPMLALEKRLILVEQLAEDLGGAGRVRATAFSGLLVNFAKAHGATIVLRGLRDSADFAYEMQMAGMNATMAPALETVFVPARPANRHVTATLVRQIAGMGGDISAFVPEPVRAALADINQVNRRPSR